MSIEQATQELIAQARAEGKVVTIELASAWPPAMGAYRMIGGVRPARHAPVPDPSPRADVGRISDEQTTD
jgi:hypothetical protein